MGHWRCSGDLPFVGGRRVFKNVLIALRRAQGERILYVRGEPFGWLRTGLANHERMLLSLQLRMV